MAHAPCEVQNRRANGNDKTSLSDSTVVGPFEDSTLSGSRNRMRPLKLLNSGKLGRLRRNPDTIEVQHCCITRDLVRVWALVFSVRSKRFWTTVCKTVRPMLSDRCLCCLSVMSVTLVYYGQTVGQHRMPLDVEVGLGPGHIVLDGYPAPLRKGAQQPPVFGACLLWTNGRPSQLLLRSCYL